MNLRRLPKRLGKIFLRLLALLAILLFLLIAFLHTPWGQRQLTTRVESYLHEQLQTELGIGGIGLGFPHLLSLRDVYLNTPRGDSLFRLGDLSVDLRLGRLLHREVQITRVELSGVFGRVIRTDSTSNIDFILAAFASADTTAAPPPADAEGSPWAILLHGAELHLHDIELYYQDDPGGLGLDLQLDDGRLWTDSVDLLAQTFLIHSLDLRGTDLDLWLGLSTNPPDTTATTSLLRAACLTTDIEDFNLALRMDSLAIAVALNRLEAGDLSFTSGDSLLASLARLDLALDSLRYDQVDQPHSAGLDPNHLAARALQLTTEDFQLAGSSIDLALRELTVEDVSGLAVREGRAEVHYDPELLTVDAFHLKTDHTELEAPELRYVLPSPTEAPGLDLTARASGYLGIRDLLTLFPDLEQYAVLDEHPDSRIDFASRIYTERSTLYFPQFEVYGPGLICQLSGQGMELLDSTRRKVALRLTQLDLRPADIRPLLPADLLPAGIDWPRRILAQGQVTYTPQQITADLEIDEERVLSSRPSRIAFAGWWQPAAPWQQSPLDLRLDTLVGTRTTVYAYLPPGAWPAGYELPDYVQASGHVTGTPDSLRLNLHFGLPENTTFADLEGRVMQPTDPERLRLDLQINSLALRRADVMPLLPDSLLPATLRLPDLRIEQASLRGALDDLTFRIP
ncbi:MAG: AsmA family protein, partial [Lewinella sp.]|nr:AsmA family protein [Lewinella sp.]